MLEVYRRICVIRQKEQDAQRVKDDEEELDINPGAREGGVNDVSKVCIRNEF